MEEVMTNKNFWLGILVMILVFGMTVLGCKVPEETASFDGSWGNFYNEGDYAFSGDNFSFDRNLENGVKGTFTYTSTHIIFTQTHRQKFDNSSLKYYWNEDTSPPTSSRIPEYFRNPRPASYKFERDKEGKVIRLVIDDVRYGKNK
jgi:hypothetical protein